MKQKKIKTEEAEHCIVCHRFIGFGNAIPVCSKDCEERMIIEIQHDAEYRKALLKSESLIVGIDPGTTQSAFVLYNTLANKIEDRGIVENKEFRKRLRLYLGGATNENLELRVAIEMVQSFGMPVGKEVFETVLFIGRCQEIADIYSAPLTMVYRKDIKIHFCGTTKAKDANIRQALLDKVGLQGTKKAPGPTYGISKDAWSALAVAIYFKEVCLGRG